MDPMSPASAEEFRRVMILVVGTGLLAFGISGTLLWLFFRSLQQESAEGARRLTTRSALLLVSVLASLLVFSLVFAGLAYR